MECGPGSGGGDGSDGGDGDGWVDDEIEKELASLTLEDLLQEESSSSSSSSSSSFVEAPSHAVSSLFHSYLNALQETQVHLYHVITDAQEILANVSNTAHPPPPLTSSDIAHPPPPLTSSDIAHPPPPLTSSDIAHPLRSSDIAHPPPPLTSSDIAHPPPPLTSSDIAHPLRSSDIAHPPPPLTSSDIAHPPPPLTSSDIAHPLRSSDIAHPPPPFEDDFTTVNNCECVENGNKKNGNEISAKNGDKAGSQVISVEVDSSVLIAMVKEEQVRLEEELENEFHRKEDILNELIAKREIEKLDHNMWLAEMEMSRRTTATITLQAAVRGWRSRRSHGPKLREARQRKEAWLVGVVIPMQARARGYLVRQSIQGKIKNVCLFQAHVRGYLTRQTCRTIIRHQSKVITSLQSKCRGYLMRRENQLMLDKLRLERELQFECSLIQFQAHLRGYLIRKCLSMKEDTTLKEIHLYPPTIDTTTSPYPPHGKVSPDALVSQPNASYKLTISRRLQSTMKNYECLHSDLPVTTPTISASSLPADETPMVTMATTTLVRDDVEGSLEAEEKALHELHQTRQEEVGVAQQSRERMLSIMNSNRNLPNIIAMRDKTSYQKELDNSCSSLPASVWLDLIEQRMITWKSRHTHKPPKKDKSWPSESHKTTPPTPRPITKAVLLGASPKGLKDVIEVMIYRSHDPIDITSLRQYPELRTITITKSQIETLIAIDGCPYLTQLNMSSNGMKYVSLGYHDNLTFVDLSDNHLVSIHGFDHTPNLIQLVLSGNRLTRVTGFNGCPRLQRLILDSNLLINCKGLEELSELEYLSCCGNHLPHMEGLHHSIMLQHLLLSQNNLQQVPSLPYHVLLRELRLDENSLSDVSSISDGWLPSLQTLSLANNCISQVNSLSCLLMLQCLDLSNNSIYDLPLFLQDLRGCYQLNHLYVSGNPIIEERGVLKYLSNAVPSLEYVDVGDVIRGCVYQLPEVVTTSNIYVTCDRQIREQDDLKDQQIFYMKSLVNDEDSFQNTVKGLEVRITHCHDYHRLLCQHLKEHETLCPGKWTPSQDTPSQDTPSQDTPSQDTTSQDTPSQDTPSQDTPSQDTPSQDTPSQDTTSQDTPSQDTKKHIPNTSSSLCECLDEMVSASIVIQAKWRGICGRRKVDKIKQSIMKRNRAATMIQALFKGYVLRKRLIHLLEQKEKKSSDLYEREWHGEEFNYEEEIVLDFLDENILESDLNPSMNGVDEITAVMLPAFSLPGATDSEITYEEWKVTQQQHYHQQHHLQNNHQHQHQQHHLQEDISAHQLSDSLYHRHGDGSPTKHPPLRGKGRVPVTAWGNTTHLHHRKEGEGQESQHQEKKLKMEHTISDEWGFTSDKTAQLMLKRVQRQHHMKTSSTYRKKLTDPVLRLARFHIRNDHMTSNNKRTTGQSSKPLSPPVTGNIATKDHFLYQWMHNQKVVHATKSSSADHTYTGLLPHLEPRVLTGHSASLVSGVDPNNSRPHPP